MARPKKEASSLKDLYTEAAMEVMYLKRAWRVLKEHHPDFRNLPLVEDRGEEALTEFLGRVKHIAEEARRKGGAVMEVPNGIPTMYIGLDIAPMFNPATTEIADLFNDED